MRASAGAGASAVPDALVGTWSRQEFDANAGETWSTTYRIVPCRVYDEPWKRLGDDQQCGAWEADAVIEGQRAHCAGTLAWLGVEDHVIVFLASGPERSSKYRTIPHPYLRIDDAWYCRDTFRLRLSPVASGDFQVETIGAGAQAGAFAATRGTITKSGG